MDVRLLKDEEPVRDGPRDDLAVGGMDGPALAGIVQERRPQLDIQMMSRGSRTLATLPADPLQDCLAAPFDPWRPVAAVQAPMNRPAS